MHASSTSAYAHPDVQRQLCVACAQCSNTAPHQHVTVLEVSVDLDMLQEIYCCRCIAHTTLVSVHVNSRTALHMVI